MTYKKLMSFVKNKSGTYISTQTNPDIRVLAFSIKDWLAWLFNLQYFVNLFDTLVLLVIRITMFILNSSLE